MIEAPAKTASQADEEEEEDIVFSDSDDEGSEKKKKTKKKPAQRKPRKKKEPEEGKYALSCPFAATFPSDCMPNLQKNLKLQRKTPLVFLLAGLAYHPYCLYRMLDKMAHNSAAPVKRKKKVRAVCVGTTLAVCSHPRQVLRTKTFTDEHGYLGKFKAIDGLLLVMAVNNILQ